jgi:hypothetical protein
MAELGSDFGPDDNDSAIGLDSGRSSWATATSFECLEEYGRTYHTREDVRYDLPNDKREQERQKLEHLIYRALLQNRLYLAPIGDSGLALDLGTGPGMWAIEFGDRHEQWNVRGVDISKIQPYEVPVNCEFLIDDYSLTLKSKPHSNFIFTRQLKGSVHHDLYGIWENLVPGGWFEVQYMCLPECEGGSIPNALRIWTENMGEVSHKVGHVEDEMRAMGFREVQSEVFRLPQNAWPEDPNLKILGRYQLVNVLEGIEGWTLRRYIEYLGWTRAATEVHLVEVRKGVRNEEIRAYWPV